MKQGPYIHIGPPAWGSDFFDREDIIDNCWNTLEQSSVILSAPRRYGKSSIMLSLRDNAKEGFVPIYFQLEDHFNLKGFVYELVSKIIENDSSIRKKFNKSLSRAFKGIEEVSLLEFKVKLKKTIYEQGAWEEWKERIIQLMLDLLKKKKNRKLLFIFDEFPLMLSNFISEGEAGEKEAVKALQWLRKLRHESSLMENTRFILGGSIGIEKVVAYLQATRTINDLPKIEVGPFTHYVAERFIRKLFDLNNVPPREKVVRRIIEVVGTMIPIYLQIIVDSLIKESMTSGREIAPDLVQFCYENRVHGTDYKHYFEDYYERLCRHYRGEEKLRSAVQILKLLANKEDGASFDDLYFIYQEKMGNKGDMEKFKLLLTALESDFYIEMDETGQRVFFRNTWLKDWWRIYHGS